MIFTHLLKRPLEKWNIWLDEIHNDIREILFVRYVFQEIRGIVGSNPKIQVPSLFYDLLLGICAIAVASGRYSICQLLSLRYAPIAYFLNLLFK